MREHPVDLFLFQAVEGRTLRQYPSHEQMVVLDVRLLGRAVRIAVEHPGPARELRGIVLRIHAEELDHLRIRELRSVVAKYRGEELHEEFESRDVLQHVEDAGARLRGLRVPEEGEHESAGEHHREQHLAVNRPHHGVDFDRLYPEVEPEEREVVLIGSSDPAFRVGLRDGFPRLRRLAAAHVRHVAALHVEQLRVRVVVDAPFAEAVKGRGGGGHHGVNRLSAAFDRVFERGVHVGEFVFVRMRATPGIAEYPFVVALSGLGVVEALPQRAGVLLVAAVADIRGLLELRARLAAVVLAHLEALALVLERDLPSVGVAVYLRTGLEVLAYGVGASVALVAPDHPVPDFVADC